MPKPPVLSDLFEPQVRAACSVMLSFCLPQLQDISFSESSCGFLGGEHATCGQAMCIREDVHMMYADLQKGASWHFEVVDASG